MKNRKHLSFRVMAVMAAFTLLGSYLSLIPTEVGAQQILNRRLTLQAGTVDGGAKPGGDVRHMFEFTLPGGNTVGSIKFEYCTTASDTALSPVCITPTGLDTTSATLGAEVGSVGGFTMVNTANGAPYLTRVAAPVGTNQNIGYRLDNITNPTNVNETFFVRIATYPTTDATGTANDAGTVTASTAEPIIVSGTMPESLVFCTGRVIGTTSGVPDCSTASDGAVTFDQLFSPTDVATATSQMAASTNAGSGYVITVNGTTLMSGSNEITAMDTADFSINGIGQFGMNLKANTTTDASENPIGIEVAPASDGVNLKGQSAAGYDTIDTYKFTTGDTVANSFNNGAGGSDAQIFTVSYIANVPGNQPAGTYSTTLTYICTPTF